MTLFSLNPNSSNPNSEPEAKNKIWLSPRWLACMNGGAVRWMGWVDGLVSDTQPSQDKSSQAKQSHMVLAFLNDWKREKERESLELSKGR